MPNYVASLHRVFVYGTLLSNHHNHFLLDRGGAEFVGLFKTVDTFTMVDFGGYPVVVTEPKAVQIVGELYLVNDETLAHLDRLEWGYQRREVQLTTVSDEGTMRPTANMYLMTPADLKRWVWDDEAEFKHLFDKYTISDGSWDRHWKALEAQWEASIT